MHPLVLPLNGMVGVHHVNKFSATGFRLYGSQCRIVLLSMLHNLGVVFWQIFLPAPIVIAVYSH